MAVYGTQGDLLLNKDAQLYTPGKTVLGKGDVYLGGPGTGMTKEQLNGAEWVWGDTAQDTANAYKNYQSDQAKTNYQNQLTNYQSQVAQQAAAAKQLALRQAWESNQQGLNSQNTTVTNNYQSAANKLNALKQARLPEYQAQKDATSADAAAQLRRTQALNALSGKYFSGANRSQQLNVDLARQNALQGIQQSQNAFNTDVGNQLSDVDAQRVAALNDIAAKLQLGQQQYNDGSLSVANQLQSEIATGALKASMDAQTWADQQKQLGIENAARQSQLDQAAKLAELQQAWQEKQFAADQESQAFNQALQQGQLTGVYNGQSTLAAQAQAAEQAYRQASGNSSGSKKPTVTELNYQDKQNSQQATSSAFQELQGLASIGKTRDEIIDYIYSNAGPLMSNGVDVESLANLAKQAFQWNGDTYNEKNKIYTPNDSRYK